MQGASRDSLATAKRRLAEELGEPGADPTRFFTDLVGVVDVLDREISLRRVLTDPAAAGERKAALVHSLFDGKVGAGSADLLAEIAAARWSRPRDLADAVEELAVQSAVTAAQRDGYVDDLEDALFRFGRLLAGEPELRGALADPAVAAARKVELVRSLLASKVRAVTLRLVEHAVAAPRGRTLDRALEDYAELAAAHRRRVVAVVRAALPLTDEQHARLAAGLRGMYGHEVNLNVVIDPAVHGGISVQVGGEVIDATIGTKLDEARRRLAS